MDDGNQQLDKLQGNIDKLTNENAELLDQLFHYQMLEEELRINQESLKFHQERIHGILSSLDDVVWSMVPHTSQILYINDAVEKVYGQPISAFLENLDLWQEIIHFEDRELFTQSQEDLYRTGKQDVEYRVIWPNGEIHWVHLRSHLILNQEGKPIRVDGLSTEITEHKRIQEQLRHDALHDSLTGLPNRNLLSDRIAQAIKRFQRSPEQGFAILFLDLDGFKVVNDSLGHLSGDKLLIKISHRLAGCLRAEDTLARLGGDEFVILLESINAINDAMSIANRVHRALKPPIILEQEEIFISASIGIVAEIDQNLTHNYNFAADILRDADTAMYRAKGRGKGLSQIFDASMHTYAVKRLQLSNDLQRAIDRQEFVVYYQPIISLINDRIEGFEALVRWEHPEKGLVSPEDFISIAEETDNILSIDEWVLRQACSQLSVWQEQFPSPTPLTMNVNLSSKHLSGKNKLIQLVDEVLAQTGLESSTLKLEITESALIENVQTAIKILHQVKQRRIGLCLDDFGTGYSSFSYLDRFSFSVLKIDRSFTQRLINKNDQCEIIKAIIDLSLTLGMNVVAEGVETKEQMERLKALKCSSGQGYGFSRPLRREAMTEFLQAKYTLQE